MSIATTLSKIQVSYFAKFILLLVLATGAPMLGIHSQWLTGPIVNAALILSVFLVGIRRCGFNRAFAFHHRAW